MSCRTEFDGIHWETDTPAEMVSLLKLCLARLREEQRLRCVLYKVEELLLPCLTGAGNAALNEVRVALGELPIVNEELSDASKMISVELRRR